jgi:hypothetical protein
MPTKITLYTNTMIPTDKTLIKLTKLPHNLIIHNQVIKLLPNLTKSPMIIILPLQINTITLPQPITHKIVTKALLNLIKLPPKLITIHKPIKSLVSIIPLQVVTKIQVPLAIIILPLLIKLLQAILTLQRAKPAKQAIIITQILLAIILQNQMITQLIIILQSQEIIQIIIIYLDQITQAIILIPPHISPSQLLLDIAHQ